MFFCVVACMSDSAPPTAAAPAAHRRPPTKTVQHSCRRATTCRRPNGPNLCPSRSPRLPRQPTAECPRPLPAGGVRHPRSPPGQAQHCRPMLQHRSSPTAGTQNWRRRRCGPSSSAASTTTRIDGGIDLPMLTQVLDLRVGVVLLKDRVLLSDKGAGINEHVGDLRHGRT